MQPHNAVLSQQFVGLSRNHFWQIYDYSFRKVSKFVKI